MEEESVIDVEEGIIVDDEAMAQSNLKQLLEIAKAKSAKSSMNGRVLQAKHTTLADDARSKAFSLKKELLAAM